MSHPNSTSLTKKLPIMLVVVLLLMASVGIGGFFLGRQKPAENISLPTPTPDPKTAGWKTYTNRTYGYTIQYPSNTLVRLICPGEEDNLYFYKKTESDTKSEQVMPTCERDSRYPIEITVLKGPFEPPQDTENFDAEEEDAVIGGVKAKKYTVEVLNPPLGPYEDWYTELFVDYKGNMYSMYLKDKDLLSQFSQILSTLQFTK